MACTPDLAAVEVTALKASELNSFNEQYRRLLNHSTLKGLHWVNVFRDVVTFTTLRPGKE